MEEYNHKSVEEKWQSRWEKEKVFVTKEDASRKKYYLLVEFPYPSGEGLHVGHVRSYTALDAVARKKRSEGMNVLYPIGWDAFGLPTENYAVKTGIHPKEVTKNNTDTFRRQLKSLGFSFDWSREINTTDPKYYKWTQWIFLQMFKEGLAYKKKMPINWCLSCKIGLANEEVLDGKCERCGGDTEKREKEQWMLAITEYADRLDRDLDTVDYLDRIKIQQRNWIGRSEGVEIEFGIKDSDLRIIVFTTRPDTLFGATYMVLAPEHPLVEKLSDNKAKPHVTNREEVRAYVKKAIRKTEIERTAEGKEKTGVRLEGISAINPANGEEIPVFVADYVLAQYGTGAIMAVPAHDERDHSFATKYDLKIKEVIEGGKEKQKIFTGYGALVNSGKFSGLSSSEAGKEISKEVKASEKVVFKLRDWIFSRQRYWGEPIPLVFCESCKKQAETSDNTGKEKSKGEKRNPGWIPMPESELPVKLPDVENFKPTDSGESPLATMNDWVNVKCPMCGKQATRETDTMPNWAGSSWYYLRYIDPKNDVTFAGNDKLKYWIPVDWYNGGMEHITLHLLYSRFWHKFLYDMKLVPTSEPYQKRTSHGLILAKGGVKMSKSKGNVVSPDDVISAVGADTLRVYEMFTGPFDQSFAWDTDNMVGSRRFLERIWKLSDKLAGQDLTTGAELNSLVHKTIKKVGEDIENLKLNTAISQLMILTNELEKEKEVSRDAYRILLKLLSPFAPHITEELREKMGEEDSVHSHPWPEYDSGAFKSETMLIVVEVDGKVRGEFNVDSDTPKDKIEAMALKLPTVSKWLESKKIKKTIYVPERLINFVT